VKAFVRLADAGVLAHLEQPAIVTGLLRNFLPALETQDGSET